MSSHDAPRSTSQTRQPPQTSSASQFASRSATMASRTNVRLPPEVNRTLYVRNLPFNISPEELYDIFGKYGALRQVRLGDAKATKGTAYVTYEDIFDAKHACEHLSGFNVANRYLIVLYYQPAKAAKKDLEAKEREIQELQRRHGVSGSQER
jgi:pre-mRNA branch site protein p14